jgi:hypothetical protein
MRVFLSIYPGFTLAIPMDVVASMMLYNQKTEKTIQYDQKSRCTFISLPWLFNMREEPVPHGIILREWNSKENKVVLLTAGIKRDIDIPVGEFSPIPKSLGALRFSEVFSGIKFSGNPILLMNVEKLLQVIQNERFVTDKKPAPPPPPPAPVEVIEEPPPSPEAALEPSPPAPVEAIEEPPPSPEAALEPSPPPAPVEVIEEPPPSPEAALEPSPPTPVEAIEEPLTSPAVTPELSSLTLEPQTSPKGEVSPLVEILEVCELIEEPSKSPAVTSEPSPPTPNEVIEAIEVCEVAEVCEVIEACEIIEVIKETPETFSLTLEPQTSPEDEVSPLAEVLELCEIIE